MKFSQMPYSRVDMDEVRRDLKELIGRLDRAKSGEEQFAVHQDYYRITDHFMTLMTIAEIRHDIDMTDEFYRKEQDYYDTVQPEIRNLNVAYQKKLYESPYRSYLEEKIEPCMHLVDNAKKVMAELGLNADTSPIRGGTDGSQLSYRGLPCPNLGTGGYCFHGPLEHITAENMDMVVRIILGIVRCYTQK